MFSDRREGARKGISPYIGTPTVMVRRAFVAERGLTFPEDMRFGQDVVFWEQLAAQDDALYLPECTARVRIRGTNAGRRAAVQLHTRAAIYDKCAALIPSYKSSRSRRVRTAAGLCRFFRRFVKRDSTGKLNELWARVLFVAPYLLYKSEARRIDRHD